MKFVAVSLMSLTLLAACQERAPRRTWRPEDHAGYVAPTAPTTQAAPAPEPQADPQAAIAALYRIQCAGCHGPQGRGDGPSKPPGAQMPNFADAAWQSSRSDEELASSLVRGKGMMPAFGTQLPAETIARLVVHVRSLRAP